MLNIKVEDSLNSSRNSSQASFTLTNNSSVRKTINLNTITLVDNMGRKFESYSLWSCNNPAPAISNMIGENRINQENIELIPYIPCEVKVKFLVAPDVMTGTLTIEYE